MVVAPSELTVKSVPAKAGSALLSNVTWEALEQIDAAIAGTEARLTYLDGWLEIMAPLFN